MDPIDGIDIYADSTFRLGDDRSRIAKKANRFLDLVLGEHTLLIAHS